MMLLCGKCKQLSRLKLKYLFVSLCWLILHIQPIVTNMLMEIRYKILHGLMYSHGRNYQTTMKFCENHLNIQWLLFTENKHNMLLLSIICQHNSQCIKKNI